jgi:hypothetical protein
MRLWAKVASCSKPAGEVLKQLFHTIREQRLSDSPTSDVGAVDKAILKAAYDYCINIGNTSNIALEEFHSIGAKLAMMHMPFAGVTTTATGGANTGTITAAERFYPAVPGVVELGIDLAASDDVFLHGVLPYCSRLKQPHARSLIDVLAQNEYFTTEGQGQHSSYARAFVAALRRAAKLDAGGGASASASVFATAPGGGANSVAVGRVGVTGTSVSKPRQMKLGGAALAAPTADEDVMFNEILRSQHAGTRRGRQTIVQQEMVVEAPSPQSNSNKKKPANSAAAVVATSNQKKPVGKKSGGSGIIVASQQSNNSEGDEMMLATQEWN